MGPNTGGGEDPRFWYPKLDAEGNGYAVVRFLPATKGSNLPWALMRLHKFQTPTGWFWENCLTTIDKDCPVCKANQLLWNSGIESQKKLASSRKRKITYYANVLIINDPATPENNGKVKIFRFGSQIFEMLMGAAKPKFADETPIDAFDPFETGANFKLKIYKADGNVKYDKSGFDVPKPMGDDAFIEKIWDQQHDLQPLVGPSNFKSFEELQALLNRKLGLEAQAAAGQSVPAQTVGRSEEAPRTQTRSEESPAPSDSVPFDTGSSSSDDDVMALFRGLGAGT